MLLPGKKASPCAGDRIARGSPKKNQSGGEIVELRGARESEKAELGGRRRGSDGR